MSESLTRPEMARVVRKMRDDGYSYNAIQLELGCSKTECYVLSRYDVRVHVMMRCTYCGKSWSELKMPDCNEVFHRCSECATVLWAKSIAARALAEQILAREA